MLYEVITGTVCLVAMLAWFAVSGGAPAGAVYVPPEYKDGKIVPGHYLRNNFV